MASAKKSNTRRRPVPKAATLERVYLSELARR